MPLQTQRLGGRKRCWRDWQRATWTHLKVMGLCFGGTSETSANPLYRDLLSVPSLGSTCGYSQGMVDCFISTKLGSNIKRIPPCSCAGLSLCPLSLPSPSWCLWLVEVLPESPAPVWRVPEPGASPAREPSLLLSARPSAR